MEKLCNKRHRDGEQAGVPDVKRLKLTHTDGSLCGVPSELLLLIFSFLDLTSLNNVSRVSIQWNTISSDDEVWRSIYERNLHLPELVSQVVDELDGEAEEEWYTECCTWKPSLVLQRMDAVGDVGADLRPQVNLSKLISRFGAPLCKGTIEEQFHLIQDQHYLSEFKQEVEQVLGVKDLHIEEDYRSTFKDLCEHEQNQYSIYVENQEANRRDNDSHIVVGNFSGCRIYPDDEEFENYLMEGEFMPFCINSGIQRISRRGGVLYYEPEAISVMQDALKNFLGDVIKEAAKKLEEKDVMFYQTNYTGFWNENPSSNAIEDDNVDKDLKIQDVDIVKAIKKLYDETVYGCIDYNNAKKDEESDTDTDSATETDDEAEMELEDIQEEGKLIETDAQDHFPFNMLASSDHSSSDDSFIDDSELENINPDNLGHTLQDELIKVSIRVHEEVYGKERTHNEKLYLKNWYGYGPSMFQHTATNSEEYVDDDFDYSGKKEQEIIDHDMKEDLVYYGNSLYDETDNGDEDGDDDYDRVKVERAEEEEHVDGTEYHLRRLLRQESLLCINRFFFESESGGDSDDDGDGNRDNCESSSASQVTSI